MKGTEQEHEELWHIDGLEHRLPQWSCLLYTSVHNDYLNTLCEWGAAGMGIVVVTCGLLAWGVVRTWRAARRPANDFGARKSDRTAFLVGASAGLVAEMLHCIVDFNMQIPANAITAIRCV